MVEIKAHILEVASSILAPATKIFRGTETTLKNDVEIIMLLKVTRGNKDACWCVNKIKRGWWRTLKETPILKIRMGVLFFLYLLQYLYNRWR